MRVEAKATSIRLEPAVLAALFGVGSVVLFLATFCLFALTNSEFDFFRDHISKLGAGGGTASILWNLIGFATVGIGLAVFGWLFGTVHNDRVLGACLMVAGIGFAMGAIPTDFSDSESPFSKAHFVAICLSLAGWLFGLARLLASTNIDEKLRMVTKYIIASTLVPVLAVTAKVISEPVAHRLLIVAIFSWVSFVSFRLLRGSEDFQETT